ncbi:MAG: hypothetical protein JWR61_5878 [Ferruginibacter sp.]|uniref:phage tail fiber protein n=1 Tax=Ferruginibacter sp. TaxID=1940288 RepID=UPI002658F01A|nr:hypothetical protein [Ferruginibacter sp.]MDB5280923.1 hypothetical protein [Ferruginibacter sp.]
MAEIFPDEGLDIILNIFPKGGTNLTTTYLGLHSAFTASTVGSSSQTLTSYTETDFASYAAQSILAASWGAIGAGTGGRLTTAAQVTFPTATGPSSLSIKGFHLRNQATFAGGKCIFAANFDDVTAVTIATNDVIKVTPTIQYNN